MSRATLARATLVQLEAEVGAEALPELIEDFLAEVARLQAELAAAGLASRARASGAPALRPGGEFWRALAGGCRWAPGTQGGG
ncbi:MAG: hypothetical protein FJX68_03690 [Alphaproteobacteria bacterium]|nr:hypothetical protein [Alphaproteobacteria bacterium]